MKPTGRTIVIAVSIILTIGIFIFDLLTPLGMAEWLLYLIPLVIASRELPRKYIYAFVVILTVFIALGFIYSPPGIQPEIALFNRSLAVGTVWIVSILLLQRRRTEEALRRAYDELEIRVEERTAELARTNNELNSEIMESKRAEGALHKMHDELELRVQERTAELEEANKALQAEIIERKQAERKLAEQAFMLANISDAVIGFDLDYRITYYSKSAEKMYGYSAEEVMGRPSLEVFQPSYLGITREEALQKLKNTGNLVAEAIHTKKDGSKVIVESHAVLLYDDHGKPIGLIGVNSDITERKKAEEALKQSEERFKAIAETTPLGIGISRIPDSDFLYVNASYEKAFGYKEGELLHKKAHDVFWDKKDREQMLKILKKNGYVTNLETRLKRKDGSMFWGIISARLIDFDGKTALLGVFNDITEHKRAEEQIQEQADLLDKAQDAIIVRDLENRITYWNKSAVSIYGWTQEEAIGKNADELLYKEVQPQLIEARESVIEKGEWMGELRQRTKEGKEIIVENRWTLVRDGKEKPKSILVINTDITEKKRLEEQTLRDQRLESIGMLAGGIAHDLNNVLTPITLSIQILNEKLKDGQSRRLLTILENNSQRAANLIKQIMLFARGVEGERKPLQVKHIISEIEKVAKETFPRNIKIRADIQKDLWMTSGDATQLHQVIMNLCMNARDAMPDGGNLSITASNFYVDEIYTRMNIEAKVGQYIVITVSDTGIGIPPEIMSRIFEPFFTTKELGKGTGLGLSTSLGIVKGHGGFIDVQSEVGKGTAFRVYLPAIKTEIQRIEEHKLELPVGYGELILVAEDEGSIREITSLTLKTYGYEVLTAEDGAQAVAEYAQNIDKIKVILMDMMIPVMDGQASIQAVRKINPAVKIIVVSGLAEKYKLGNIASHTNAFLPKPYTAEILLKTVHEVLSAK
jgi:two-component system cell cycle sensor histidine kinase/response regulator CckA